MTAASVDGARLVELFYTYLAARDRDALHQLLSPSIEVTYHAKAEHLPWAGTFEGRDGFDQFLAAVADRLEIVSAHRAEPIVGNTHVVVQTIGEWRVKATGRIVDGAMLNVFGFEDEQISRYEVYADTAAFQQALRGDDD